MSAWDRFHVALTGDFFEADGRPKYRDVGLGLFDAVPAIEVGRFAAHHAEIAPEQLAGVQGAIVLTPRVSARSLSTAGDLLAIGRFGVGYDSVDVDACTAADVVLFITAGAVDASVAEATVGWMLALGHRLRVKDALVRAGRWHERSLHMGSELREHTLGVIGYGGIGRAVVRLLAGFGMRAPLVYDPFLPASGLEGVQPVGLDELLARADYVSIHCPLTDRTRGLIGARALALMQPTAYLINTARGGIVDEDALEAALAEGRIAGAALDCFEHEPLAAPSRFARFDNVLLAPHAIAWTDELFRDIGRAACQGMIDLARGQRPRGVVNPEVFARPAFAAKWRRCRSPPGAAVAGRRPPLPCSGPPVRATRPPAPRYSRHEPCARTPPRIRPALFRAGRAARSPIMKSLGILTERASGDRLRRSGGVCGQARRAADREPIMKRAVVLTLRAWAPFAAAAQEGVPTRMPLPLPLPLPSATTPPRGARAAKPITAPPPVLKLGEKQLNEDHEQHGAGAVEKSYYSTKSDRGRLAIAVGGAAFSHSFYGLHSLTVSSLQLVQEFEIVSADPAQPLVEISLAAKLLGVLRTEPNDRATARLRVADAAIAQPGGPPLLSLGFAPDAVSGKASKRIERDADGGTAMLPPGRYVLVLNLVVETTVDKCLRGHAEALFAPPAHSYSWRSINNPLPGGGGGGGGGGSGEKGKGTASEEGGLTYGFIVEIQAAAPGGAG
jgi:phosphoglycerate dehydrogenase-like enzyme